MSLVLAGSVAVSRDLAEPGKPITCPTRPALPPSTTPNNAAPPATTTNFSHLIVAQIPTEALLAYTTLLALLSVSEDGYHAARWAIYLVSLPICGAVVMASYLRQRAYPVRRRRTKARSAVPWLSIATTVTAMGVYGLTVPGSPLQYTMSGTGFAITSGCLSVAGGLVMSIFTPFLGQGNRLPAPRTPSRSRSTAAVRPLRSDARAENSVPREDRHPAVRSVPSVPGS